MSLLLNPSKWNNHFYFNSSILERKRKPNTEVGTLKALKHLLYIIMTAVKLLKKKKKNATEWHEF